MSPLLDVSKRLIHIGQLVQVTIDSYGQLQNSTVNTVSCFVFWDEGYRTEEGYKASQSASIKALLPTSVAVAVGYKLNAVVNLSGEVVLELAEVLDIIDYHSPRYGHRLRQLILRIDE